MAQMGGSYERVAESTLYLYRISWGGGYDSYDSAVVVAESEDAARHTHPCDRAKWGEVAWVHKVASWASGSWKLGPWESGSSGSWGQPDQVTVQLLGLSYLKEPGVVVASFNAG